MDSTSIGLLFEHEAHECKEFHKEQIIPHPMYRYQANPSTYGNATWACHQGCHTYTHWKIVRKDIKKVPIADAQDSWGLRNT